MCNQEIILGVLFVVDKDTVFVSGYTRMGYQSRTSHYSGIQAVHTYIDLVTDPGT